MKKLKLSLIIPIYNEEHHIARCIEAAINQAEPFYEVIVIDNNSNDNSAKIAKSYKGVKVLSENTQGLTHARNKGFSVANGDIFCRIDADAELRPEWSKVVRRTFELDSNIGAITGLAWASLFPRIKHPGTTFWARGYYMGIGLLYKTQMLWGANMAIKKSVWLEAKQFTSLDDSLVHEDQDLSIAVVTAGYQIVKQNNLIIDTNGQTYHYFPKLYEYIKRDIDTYNHHKSASRIPVPKKFKISKLSILTRYLLSPFAILFFITSFLYWPIDELMLRIGHEKTWFH